MSALSLRLRGPDVQVLGVHMECGSFSWRTHVVTTVYFQCYSTLTHKPWVISLRNVQVISSYLWASAVQGCLERKSVSPKTQENRGRVMPDCKKTILSLPQVTEERDRNIGPTALVRLVWHSSSNSFGDAAAQEELQKDQSGLQILAVEAETLLTQI